MRRKAFLGATGAALWSPGAAGAARLDDQIARSAAASSGVVGVYARKLSRSTPVTYNADEVFPTASVIKVVILVSLFQYAEATRGVMQHKITLQLADFVGGSEILDAYNPGSSLSVDTLARAMIEQSDNTASNVLISYLGFERIGRTIERAGLRNTHLRRHFMDTSGPGYRSENLTTARDMGTLLYGIERGAHEAVATVASPRSCRQMIDILLRQEDRDKIARGLPRGVPLANKTGEIDGVRNDIGIVDPYGDSPYVIAVLTKDLGDFSLGNIAIRRIARAVHSALY
ncbi:MAG: class A beta-lactamase-related serine hydrolase [Candidatus Eremiobacteraeota bacterium]|nr:class A beta-lactamase-related serine hydrolase [Candidatus Eremiobacteraeota bacterium]